MSVACSGTETVVSPASLLDSQQDVLHHRTRRRSLVKLRRRFGLALSANVVALSAKMNKTTPHNNRIHFLVQEIPGSVETKPPTEFDQTPSSHAVMQYIRAVNQGGWLARLRGQLVLVPCKCRTRYARQLGLPQYSNWSLFSLSNNFTFEKDLLPTSATGR